MIWKDSMAEKTGNVEDIALHEKSGPEPETEIPDREKEKTDQSEIGSLRTAGYFVLFIAAVFAVNAMETGSYRTPWPVAIVTVLIGVGLLGYSWYLQSRSKT
jgi:hypothetical protein